MKKQTLFWGGILLVLVGRAGEIFFLIPGIPHLITDTHTHVKHSIAAFVLGVLGILVALVHRPLSRARYAYRESGGGTDLFLSARMQPSAKRKGTR